MSDKLTFILNGKRVDLTDFSPTQTLLSYLRNERALTGTKEGCAEGDCGACTVIVGELQGDQLHYISVNACISFLPMLHGKLVISVEGLAGPQGELHPVQQAIIDQHGSQCGFCTPGFVMSLYALHLAQEKPDCPRVSRDGISHGLAGNLCRCTGYGPLISAGEQALAKTPPAWEKARQTQALKLMRDIERSGQLTFSSNGQRWDSPVELEELAQLYKQFPEATLVAGASDIGLWVTKQLRTLPHLIDVTRVQSLRQIKVHQKNIRIGAAVRYSDVERILAEHFTDFGELIRRIGAAQVRNAGTIGANIANGSPIGDTPPALIALGATLYLRRGSKIRSLPMEDYFIAYGQQDRAEGEFVEAIELPTLKNPDQLKCYKLSKRFDQDISSLCGCFNLTIEYETVVDARIAYGGMAEIPQRAHGVEQALIGKPWTLETIENALPAYAKDFTPFDDMRGSGEYRLLAARNLLLKLFEETDKPLAHTRLVGRGSALV